MQFFEFLRQFGSRCLYKYYLKKKVCWLVWDACSILVWGACSSKVCMSRGGGYSHIWPNGDVPPKGNTSLQEILKHGSHFLPKKSLNMGQLFWLSPKLRDFWGFRHVKTPKIVEFLKNRLIFEEKSLKMGTLFGQNHPYRWVWVLRLQRHTPVQLKPEYPPEVYVRQWNNHLKTIAIITSQTQNFLIFWLLILDSKSFQIIF